MEKIGSVGKMEKLGSDIQEIYVYQRDPEYVLDKPTEVEGRSRRNNLRIYEIEDTKGETLNNREEKVQNMFA